MVQEIILKKQFAILRVYPEFRTTSKLEVN